MTKGETYDQIERYLAGAMAAEEQAEFEVRLTADRALMQELALHRQVQSWLADTSLQRLQETLNTVNAEWKMPEGKTRKRLFGMPYWASIAATFAFLVLGFWLIKSAQSPDPENLFASHFKPYEMVLTVRGNQPSADSNDVMRAAILAYNSQDFATASNLFDQMAQSAPENAGWPFYQAVSLLASGNSRRAASIFKDISQQPANMFQEQALWYLALSYLKSGDTAAAKDMLQKIESGHRHYDEARKLLEALGD